MLGRLSTCVSTAAVAAMLSTGASAGVCPEDQVLTEPMKLEMQPSVGVGRELLSSVDLTGWRDLGNFRLRLRRLVIDAHGIVPTHSHADRPSIVYIVDGELIEHNVYCAVPIVHKAGDTTAEAGPGHVHWWENPTDKPVTVFSTDVIPFEAKPNSSEM